MRVPLGFDLNARWRKVVNVTHSLLYPSWVEPSHPVKWSQGPHVLSGCVVDERGHMYFQAVL